VGTTVWGRRSLLVHLGDGIVDGADTLPIFFFVGVDCDHILLHHLRHVSVRSVLVRRGISSIKKEIASAIKLPRKDITLLLYYAVLNCVS